MTFTALTVVAAEMHLGALEIWVAMGIATFKSILVALYFMHLRYDRPFHGVIVIGALLFVLLFIGITMLDSAANR
jgi:cytochrome c oxidase subunit 4